MIVFSISPEETFSLGEKLGKWIKVHRFKESQLKKSQTICFFGDLAAGKTTFIKGFISEVARIPLEQVSSPTFVLLNIYEGEQPIYHFDLYRLENAEGFFSLGFEEYWNAPGVCCIEWAERIEEVVPANSIYIRMKSLSENKREISFEGIDDLEKI